MTESTPVTEHNLIHKRQYGFRENHSTELAITAIMMNYSKTLTMNQ